MSSPRFSVFASALICLGALTIPAHAAPEPLPEAGVAAPETDAAKDIGTPAPPAASEAIPAAPQPALVQVADPGPAQKLQELIGTRLADFIERKSDQAAVEGFYRERGFQPLWTSNGATTSRATAAVEFLKNVTSEGLNPSDYATPALSVTLTDDNAATDEIRLTRAVLTYARHASGGRVSFTRVSGAILYPSHALEPALVLKQLAASQNLRDTLLSFEPQQPGFNALKTQLAKERAVPHLANDLSRWGGAKHAGADVVGLIIANMERWRWLPRDLGGAYVMVNVPDYTLAVSNNGHVVWRTKIVVGKPGDMATPLLSETMKYLTINPTWNVPPSIIRNEYLPALQRDPDALERTGLKVGRNPDGSIRVYQPPGARNALGRIRFNFPNPFLVYQHDTPNKNYFARDNRALSHGCMRVQDPEKYAEVLLSLSQPQDGVTAKRIASYYGDDERTIKLQRPIPVHVTYQTAVFDEAGQFRTRDDIYGLDAAVLKFLRGSERLNADIPIARNYESSSKPVLARLPSRPLGAEQDKNERYGRGDWPPQYFTTRYFDHGGIGTW